MQYNELYQKLKEAFDFNQKSSEIVDLNLRITKYQSTSLNVAEDLLNGSSHLSCPKHDIHFKESDVINNISGNTVDTQAS